MDFTRRKEQGMWVWRANTTLVFHIRFVNLNGFSAEKVKIQLFQLMEAGYEDVAELLQNGGHINNEDEKEAVMHSIEQWRNYRTVAEAGGPVKVAV